MIPQVSALPKIVVTHPQAPQGDGNGQTPFLPYKRDERLVRPWAIPGTPGLEHRIGGLEKEDVTGNVCYDPANHEHMVKIRAQKIANIANDIPLLQVKGPEKGDLLVIGWGGTYGAITTAVDRALRKGLSGGPRPPTLLESHAPEHCRAVLGRYKKILVPELNNGQLRTMLRSTFLVDAIGLNKIQGRPFLVSEIEKKIEQMI